MGSTGVGQKNWVKRAAHKSAIAEWMHMSSAGIKGRNSSFFVPRRVVTESSAFLVQAGGVTVKPSPVPGSASVALRCGAAAFAGSEGLMLQNISALFLPWQSLCGSGSPARTSLHNPNSREKRFNCFRSVHICSLPGKEEYKWNKVVFCEILGFYQKSWVVLK